MPDRGATSFVLFASLACAGLAACADVARVTPPAAAASFAGRIAAIEPGTMLLVATSVQPAGADRAAVRLHAGTRVFLADGEPTNADALKVGQGVRAWFDGPVMESYPVQATAGAIVIDDRRP
jgi:hypothetical protein